jgi:multidrug efflux pump
MKRLLPAYIAVLCANAFAQVVSSHTSAVISVRTAVIGASAEVVEAEVTVPLEKALLHLRGTKPLRSQSRSELSLIEFEVENTRACEALANTVAAIAHVRRALPATIQEPLVAVSPQIACS